MKLIPFGCGGYHPSEERHTSSFYLPDEEILLDAGTGTFRLAGRFRGDTLHVLLSHYHLDHICGLQYLLGVLHGTEARLVVHGPPPIDAVGRLFADPFFPVPFDDLPLEASLVETSDGDVFTAGLATVRVRRIEHGSGHSLSYRVQSGARSLVYMTDTTTSLEHARFAAGADLLVHECYFPDAMAERALATGHSYSRIVAELAREAGVARLALCHIDPSGADPGLILDEVMSRFPATFLLEELAEVEV